MDPKLPTAYDAYFSDPPLIHPIVHVRLHPSSSVTTEDDAIDTHGCALHTTVYMNDRLFVDPYELEDRWGPASLAEDLSWDPSRKGFEDAENHETTQTTSKNSSKSVKQHGMASPATSIRWTVDPQVPDLERPVRYQFAGRMKAPIRVYRPRSLPRSDGDFHQTKLDNSEYPYEAVLHIVQHSSSSPTSASRGSFDLDIPTHMRYQEPSTSDEGSRVVTLGNVQTSTGAERPQEDVVLDVSWSCRDLALDDDGCLARDGNDHTTTHLQLVAPAVGRPHHIALPTAIASHVALVPPLTFVVVLLSWMYITKALFRLWRRSQISARDTKTL